MIRPVVLSFTGDIGGRNSDILNWFIRFYLLNLQALIFMNQVIDFNVTKFDIITEIRVFLS